MKHCGSCLCKKITFVVEKIQGSIGHCHCHCKMCQKFHGSAFSTFAEASKKDLIWLSGEEELKHYRADNKSVRSFSHLYYLIALKQLKPLLYYLVRHTFAKMT